MIETCTRTTSSGHGSGNDAVHIDLIPSSAHYRQLLFFFLSRSPSPHHFFLPFISSLQALIDGAAAGGNTLGTQQLRMGEGGSGQGARAFSSIAHRGRNENEGLESQDSPNANAKLTQFQENKTRAMMIDLPLPCALTTPCYHRHPVQAKKKRKKERRALHMSAHLISAHFSPSPLIPLLPFLSLSPYFRLPTPDLRPSPYRSLSVLYIPYRLHYITIIAFHMRQAPDPDPDSPSSQGLNKLNPNLKPYLHTYST